MALVGYVAEGLLDGGQRAPPGSPPTQKFVGPWFSTQLILSLSIGLTSFFLFCILRTRWEVVYMGRTKLKDFSPTPAHGADAHSENRFLGWILPTLRTTEFTVLQTVGLDAAVLLNFFRMAAIFFGLAAFLAAVVLMPLNYFKHGSTDSEPELPTNDTDSDETMRFLYSTLLPSNSSTTRPSGPSTLYDLLLDPETSGTVHLIFAYAFTALALTFLHRNYHRFVRARQSFNLHLIHSISARTVLVTNIPPHYRGDRALADYFEGCGWVVESVSVAREIEPLRRVLEKRTDALLQLESAWAEWVGNPAGLRVRGYDPEVYNKEPRVAADLSASPKPATGTLIPDLDIEEPRGNGEQHLERSASTSSRADVDAWRDPEDPSDLTSKGTPESKIRTERPRPIYRPRYFGAQVDAIEYWEKKFRKADDEVKSMRKKGRFEATHVAFVTFEDIKSAQMACQVVHFPRHSEVVTQPAPEPRDVLWTHIGMSQREEQIRSFVGYAVMLLLLSFWIVPVGTVSGLLSYEEIKKVLPWLARLIDRSSRLAAIVQNSLPSLAIITFNGLLPFLLDWLSYQQGIRSRSATEYSLMRKYHLFLLVSVLFIFLLGSTYWALFADLADSPMKIPQKLAFALQASNARNFMVSYVMLQALGLMPLQLLNIGPLLSIGTARAFWTKTPRDYAEANAPPMLNYGWVYPQALLIFTITLVYSVVSPLILVFGAIYFTNAYLVYKYKLLFIYFKPYESNGEAWRITFNRALWAIIIFQLFMTGLFSLRQLYWLSVAMVPLIAYTLWWAWGIFHDFGPLSTYLALSNICEVERGGGADQVVGVDEAGTGSTSHGGLNRHRYAYNDETLYVAPSDKRTDYSQPPMGAFYYGVLNTGRRRYAHPALTGVLPYPWLPAKARPRAFGDGAAERRGVVLSLRRKVAKKLSRAQSQDGEGSGSGLFPEGWSTGGGTSGQSSTGRQEDGLASSQHSNSSNPWRDPTPTPTPSGRKEVIKTISFDNGSGVIALPDEEDNVWDYPGSEDEGSADEEDTSGGKEGPPTYFHHPERRRTVSGDGMSNGGTPAV